MHVRKIDIERPNKKTIWRPTKSVSILKSIKFQTLELFAVSYCTSRAVFLCFEVVFSLIEAPPEENDEASWDLIGSQVAPSQSHFFVLGLHNHFRGHNESLNSTIFKYVIQQSMFSLRQLFTSSRDVPLALVYLLLLLRISLLSFWFPARCLSQGFEKVICTRKSHFRNYFFAKSVSSIATTCIFASTAYIFSQRLSSKAKCLMKFMTLDLC